MQDRDAAGEREIGWMLEQRSFRRMTFALHDRRSAQARRRLSFGRAWDPPTSPARARPHFVEMFDT
ncbi:MAG: hypothetical protein CMQ24_16565, partial [Gammaproteobacteria bacterium]|nr:hypothetical protein [Gammaproteobacteria bacterium]